MGKKKPKTPSERETPTAATHNPFAALGGLRDALPAADPATLSTVMEPGEPGESSTSAEDGSRGESRMVARVVLRREKKGRGGKTVTRVQGLPQEELPAWSKKAKRSLGCGASIEGADLLLLGDLVDRGATFFESAGVKRVVRGN